MPFTIRWARVISSLANWRGLLTSLALGLLIGCSPTKLLQPGQNLLSKIKLEGVKQANEERLEALYQQKPNSKFPLPKLGIYQFGTLFYDSVRIRREINKDQRKFDAKIQAARPDSVKVGKLLTKREQHVQRHQLALDKGNAIMRIGEAPVVYDTARTRATVQQIGVFLKSQGFFRSHVLATDTVEDRQVTVTLHVTEGKPFTYERLDYDIADSAVAHLVLTNQATSLLHLHDRYNEEVIGQERSRIETLLKNSGYYDFRSQYITLEADTSYTPGTVRLRTFIANPGPNEPHQIYTIRNVNFLTDAGVTRFGVTRDTIVRDSVRYLAYKHRFSTKVLDRKLAVRPGQLYNIQNTILTQRQLADLDIFRFNTVSYRRVRTGEGDTTSRQLDAFINASPTKKYQETTELGGTYVSGKPGPFANVRLKIRNVFGGAESLELGLRAGFEGQYNRLNGQSVLTTQLGANASLILPQFLVPWRANRYLTRYNPKTRLNGTYTYVKRPEYTRTNLEGTYDYIWQRSAYHQYVLTPVDLSLVNARNIARYFQRQLDSLALTGSPLIRSFTQQFVPSMNATSLYNSNDFNQTRDARYYRLFVEIGGLTRSLYQGLLNDRNIQVYNFARLAIDYRRYIKLAPQSFFVYRFNGGVAHALSTTTVDRYDPEKQETVKLQQYIIPYDKYFFAGGASSVRAWRPRRLGPGGYATKYNVEQDGQSVLVRNYNVEQPGEVLLEGNLEYRFPVYSFIKGAVFTDFGNVWSLQKNEFRKGAEFQINQFYKQFAVGSGIGIRLDFTFLILRLDIATKVYDPTAEGSNWVLRKFSLRTGNPNNINQDAPTAFNLGIGYPF
ncbi:BamA/TamA family outer membrane protein [Hymenobacter sp. GOD-10R]|uniref:translocation and assembly module lipoprotein TamL n=1 Tax=Hymenobacter sp. GOD-10R TaxID=3093922 RepID=UPI002D799734|nr:BamA/TamA family outer membrane protein [Hymenobacter sp. GOD-10R]WRQ31030.1 BamA/TamA family outer membrane protein [Hymenobacter sp. GOD-10R]